MPKELSKNKCTIVKPGTPGTVRVVHKPRKDAGCSF